MEKTGGIQYVWVKTNTSDFHSLNSLNLSYVLKCTYWVSFLLKPSGRGFFINYYSLHPLSPDALQVFYMALCLIYLKSWFLILRKIIIEYLKYSRNVVCLIFKSWIGIPWEHFSQDIFLPLKSGRGRVCVAWRERGGEGLWGASTFSPPCVFLFMFNSDSHGISDYLFKDNFKRSGWERVSCRQRIIVNWASSALRQPELACSSGSPSPGGVFLNVSESSFYQQKTGITNMCL